MKPNYTKIFFGVIVFLFSTALAYFSADYFTGGQVLFSGAAVTAGQTTSPGFVMFIFGLIYAVAGVLLVRVIPVSLGILLAADVTLLDALARNYDSIEGMYRVGLIGLVIVFVYLFAWFRCKDSMLSGGTTETIVFEAPKTS